MLINIAFMRTFQSFKSWMDKRHDVMGPNDYLVLRLDKVIQFWFYF